MTPENTNRTRSTGTANNVTQNKLLATKQLPKITGLSESYFEKARIYGYGPNFIRIKSPHSRVGRIFYRIEDVLQWLDSQLCEPVGGGNVK